ncbi:MAG TPA: aspartate-semialdehyde dehydrogenase, partial [Deltaproteobacteria bacterium]|nr:aspartate-semialdehyde dehydrogenase [Deltaproteobacteria bacterium]
MASAGYTVAVVGATTPAGSELVRILDERNFPVRELLAFAAKGSLDKSTQYRDEGLPLQELRPGSFKGADISFFMADEKTSSEFARQAQAQGSLVIDTTPFFRMDKNVPLVVPEINPHALEGHGGIIASPSPSTVQLVLALAPIHRKATVRRVVVSTYEAISDAGESAMNELTEQIADLFDFHEARSSLFSHQIAFDAIPQTGTFLDNAYSSGEMHIIDETKKIMGDEGIRVCATAVYVPVFYSHSQSVAIETGKKIDPDGVRKLLKGAPGVKVEDSPKAGVYPLAVYATGKDECFVGRIR